MSSALRLSITDVRMPPMRNTALISLRYQPKFREPNTIITIARAMPATMTFCLPVKVPSSMVSTWKPEKSMP